ncbi:6005_t:CDS:2, partial [Racocetra persica]
STAYSKHLKPSSDYAKRLNKLRKIKKMSNNFVSNTNDLVEIYLQLIVKYFNEDLTQVLLKPLPKQMKDVDSCLNSFYIADTLSTRTTRRNEPIALEKTTQIIGR